MASIYYDEIFEQFLGEVTDHNLVKLVDADADELMVGWLKKAISDPMIKKQFSSFKNDKQIQEITYELKNSEDEESDKDFVVELIAKQMVYVWANAMLKKDENLSNFFGSKEQKFYSPAQFMTALNEVVRDSKNDVRQMVGDRGISVNSYLGGS